MPDVLKETPNTSKPEDASKPLQAELTPEDHQSQLKSMALKGATAPLNELTVTNSDGHKVGFQALPQNLDKDLKNLQSALETTQKQISDLRKTCDPGLLDIEASRRSFTGNPYKLLTAGSGLAMLYKSPALAAVPLTGYAALQGYDDYKGLAASTTFRERGKYTMSLLADTSAGAGALAFLTD
ncbi:MAG: hypothetical protein K2X81_14145, partial [Candidatus Obscuribacterales bacterium]|nr:hypothetical protein [Candidatus Obscuribacterales bacterium]